MNDSEMLTDKERKNLQLYWNYEFKNTRKIFVNLERNKDNLQNEAQVVCDLMSASVLAAHRVFVESYCITRTNFNYLIGFHFEGQVKWYLDFLSHIISNSRVLLINIFLDYVNNKSKILKMTKKERRRYATEFPVSFFFEERDFYSRDSFDELLFLTDNQIDLLNSMLKIAEQKEISKNVIHAAQKVVNNGRKETKTAIDLVNKALASI